MSAAENVLKIDGTLSTRSATHEVFIEDSEFPVINPDMVAEKLDLIAKAQEEGKKNLPPSEQEVRFSTAELEIDTEIQRTVAGYERRASARVENLDADILGTIKDNEEDIANIYLMPERFKDEVKTYLAAALTEFDEARAEFREVTREYKSFRRKNKLEERVCEPAKSRGHIFVSWSMLFIFIAFEAVINSSLFATNMSSGLIGGFGTALLLSLVNVLVCFFLGRVSRYRNLASLFYKSAGLFVFIIFAIWLVVFGLATAHFRDVLQSSNIINMSDPSLGIITIAAKESLISLKADPLGLSDIFSYLLMGVTILFGVMAFYDGLRYDDDPCPGYFKVTAKYINISGAWADAIEERRAEINKIKDKYLKSIKDTIMALHNGLVHARKSNHSKELTLSSYSNAQRSADKAFQSLVSKFRIENAKCRTTPEPVFFTRIETLDLSELPPVPHRDFTQKLEEHEQKVNELKKDSEKIREQIIQSFDEEDNKLRKIKEEEEIYAQTI